MTTPTTSTSPTGDEFPLPIEADYQAENDRLFSELIVRKLTEMGADVQVHDPYVKHWWELEKQDTYPAPGHSGPVFSAIRKASLIFASAKT